MLFPERLRVLATEAFLFPAIAFGRFASFAPSPERYFTYSQYRVGQKTDCFCGHITSQRLMIERRIIRQSFRILSRMKCASYMSIQLNILGLICINRQYPQNCIKFDNYAWVLLNFHSKYCKTKTISNTCA